MGDQFFKEEPKHITNRPNTGVPQSGFELNGQWIGPAAEYDSGYFDSDADLDPYSEVDYGASPSAGSSQSAENWSTNQQLPMAPKKKSYLPVFAVLLTIFTVLMGPGSQLISSWFDDSDGNDYGDSSYGSSDYDEFPFDTYFTSTEYMSVDPQDPELVASFDDRLNVALADELAMRDVVDFMGYWDAELLTAVEDSGTFPGYDFGVLAEGLGNDPENDFLMSEAVVLSMASGLMESDRDSDRRYMSDFLLAFSRYGNLPGQELKGGELLASKKLLDGVKESEYQVLLGEYFVEVPFEDTQLGALADSPNSDSDQDRELRGLLLRDMLTERGLGFPEE